MVEWQKYTQAEKDIPDYHKFLECLDLQATATELTTLDGNSRKPNLPKKTKWFHSGNSSTPTLKPVSAYVTNVEGKCIACNKQKHSLAYCQAFKAKPVKDKRSFVLEHKMCFNCLKGNHVAKQCPSSYCCQKCEKRHHTLLHLDTEDTHDLSKQVEPLVAPTSSDNNSSKSSDCNGSTHLVTYMATQEATTSGPVLMMTAEVILSGLDNHQMVVRALLDPASTASFVTERVAQHLKLKGRKQHTIINGIGGTQSSTRSNTVVDITLMSTKHSSSLSNVQAIVLPSLTKHLPFTSLPKGFWPHLASLGLADPEYNVSKPIDVLLGLDVYHNILKPGLILGPKGTPAAQETIFGWVLFGNTNGYQTPNEVTTLHALTSCPSCEETLQKFWSLEEPPKPKLPLSPLDKLAVQDYNQHQKRDDTGRFVVRLPFKPEKASLGESRPQALRRFLSLERRLQSSSKFQDYAKVVNEYFTSGHAERVPESDLKKPTSDSFYLAHHAVYKDFSYHTHSRRV